MPSSSLAPHFSLTRGTLAALALLGLAALPQAARAQGLINFDLTSFRGLDSYGPGPGAFGTGTSTWNIHDNSNSASSLALTNDTGAATGVTVSFTTTGAAGRVVTGAFRNLGITLIQTSAVTFAGLTPGGAYDLVIFSGSDGVPSFTVNGVTKTLNQTSDWSTLTEGTHYMSFQTVANGSGELAFTSNPNPGGIGGGNSRWSAFQLRSPATAAPEPGTLALLTLGVIGGIVARRRK